MFVHFQNIGLFLGLLYHVLMGREQMYEEVDREVQNEDVALPYLEHQMILESAQRLPPSNDDIFIEQNEIASARDEQQPTLLQKEFDQQLAIKHTIEVNGEVATYHMAEPPFDPTVSQEWIVFVGGFSTTKEKYYEELLHLAQSGRKVLFINPEMSAHTIEDEHPLTAHMHATIKSEADLLRRVLDAEGIDKADFVAHSRGAAVATTLIAQNPGRARRVLLDSPAGLIGKDTPKELMARSRKEMFARIKTEHSLKPLTSFAGRFLRRLNLHLKEEIPAIADTDIRPLLKTIHDYSYEHADDAVETILLNPQSDLIFPPDRIEAALGADPFEYFNNWMQYADSKAYHGQIYHPRTIGAEADKLPAQQRHTLIEELINTPKQGWKTEASHRSSPRA